MTPFELELVGEMRTEEKIEAYRMLICNAYYTAKLAKAKKIPPLESLTRELDRQSPSRRKERPQTVEEMYRICKSIATTLGGEVKEKE